MRRRETGQYQVPPPDSWQRPCQSGDNFFAGGGAVVIDNGEFECDGDGDVDPNFISGLTGQGN